MRNAANSAPHLLPHIKPDMRILDVGCGPGSITIDFARRVPHGSVTGLDVELGTLEGARKVAAELGISNITFVHGNAMELPFPDASFDAVHSHQVLLYLSDPVGALREMKRVCKPGCIVVARDGECGNMIWYPETEALQKWTSVYSSMIRLNGGEPNAGRRLHAWAREAGFDPTRIRCSASTWCYASAEERASWMEIMRGPMTSSDLIDRVKKYGLANDAEIQSWAKALEEWAANVDGWYMFLSGEIVCVA